VNLASYRRKLIYIGAIVAILIPLYLLGQPAVTRDNKQTSAGGTLAQIRQKYDLGQADLGKLDPASESARLATLGLRGVATSVLWHKANVYKNEMNWDRFSATLNQIALLQPHFIKVWEFQAHNLAYNVSVEFDDYRQRYAWVRRGMDYLTKGIEYNRRDANLPWFQGMFFGQKLGKSDEKKQFRKIFSADSDFHNELAEQGFNVRQEDALGPERQPDNWLVGRLWYKRAESVVESGTLLANGMRKSPLHFFSSAPLALMSFCEAIESDGILDDRAKLAWQRSGLSWSEFGDREIPTTWGHNIRLNDIEESGARVAEYEKQFRDFVGDYYQKAIDSRMAKLSDEQKEALNTPPEKRTERTQVLFTEARQIISPSLSDIAKEMPPEKRIEALQFADKAQSEIAIREHVDQYRNQVNFNYWETRCKAEQSDEAIAARQYLFQAENLMNDDVDEAIKKYDQAWIYWDKLFDKYPLLVIDEGADDVMDAISRYRRAIDSDLPDDFVLKDFLEFRAKYDEGEGDLNMLLDMAKRSSEGKNVDPNSYFPPSGTERPTTESTDKNPSATPTTVLQPDEGTPPAPEKPETSEPK
jgi:hypothetical protein